SVTSWTCSAAVTTGTPYLQSLVFDPSGTPYMVYENFSNGVWETSTINTARYVGSGGNCGSTAWTCSTISGVANHASAAFDTKGALWLSWYNPNSGASGTKDLKFSHLVRGGEITMAPSVGSGNGDAISESHTDMTSTSDTTNRDDVDC